MDRFKKEDPKENGIKSDHSNSGGRLSDFSFGRSQESLTACSVAQDWSGKLDPTFDLAKIATRFKLSTIGGLPPKYVWYVETFIRNEITPASGLFQVDSAIKAACGDLRGDLHPDNILAKYPAEYHSWTGKLPAGVPSSEIDRSRCRAAGLSEKELWQLERQALVWAELEAAFKEERARSLERFELNKWKELAPDDGKYLVTPILNDLRQRVIPQALASSRFESLSGRKALLGQLDIETTYQYDELWDAVGGIKGTGNFLNELMGRYCVQLSFMGPEACLARLRQGISVIEILSQASESDRDLEHLKSESSRFISDIREEVSRNEGRHIIVQISRMIAWEEEVLLAEREGRRPDTTKDQGRFGALEGFKDIASRYLAAYKSGPLREKIRELSALIYRKIEPRVFDVTVLGPEKEEYKLYWRSVAQELAIYHIAEAEVVQNLKLLKKKPPGWDSLEVKTVTLSKQGELYVPEGVAVRDLVEIGRSKVLEHMGWYPLTTQSKMTSDKVLRAYMVREIEKELELVPLQSLYDKDLPHIAAIAAHILTEKLFDRSIICAEIDMRDYIVDKRRLRRMFPETPL